MYPKTTYSLAKLTNKVCDKAGADKPSRAMISTKATGATISPMVSVSTPGKMGQNTRAHLRMELCMVRERRHITMGISIQVNGRKVRKMEKGPCCMLITIPMKECGKMTAWRGKGVIRGTLVIVLQEILYRIVELEKVF